MLMLRPILRGPSATPQTPARRGRMGKGARDLDTNNMAESYFEAQASKVEDAAGLGSRSRSEPGVFGSLEPEPQKIKSIRKLYICYYSLGKIVSFYG